MHYLENLNITKTKITLTDLCDVINNQSLKTIFLDLAADEKDIYEKEFILKDRMPNCNIYLDTCFAVNDFETSEKPIF